jgi:hypothetical protein
MDSEINKLYKDTIAILSYLELIIQDEKQFAIIRKQVLDLANAIKRLGDNNE